MINCRCHFTEVNDLNLITLCLLVLQYRYLHFVHSLLHAPKKSHLTVFYFSLPRGTPVSSLEHPHFNYPEPMTMLDVGYSKFHLIMHF